MSEGIKVELEISAFGRETIPFCADSFRQYQIVRTHILPKETTLGQIEALVQDMIVEIKEGYQHPEQLQAKVTLRAKETDGLLRYLG